MAESITTRRLQIARRSAEKKQKTRTTVKDHKTIMSFQKQEGVRLLLFSGGSIDPSPLTRFAAARGWNSLLPLNRIWSLGFKFEVIAGIILQLPPSLQSWIRQSLGTWDRIIQENETQSLKSSFGSWINIESIDDNFLQESISLLNNPQLPFESSQAVLRMKFDPVSQMRTDFWFNRAACAMFGMCEREFYCRLASYDLDLPFSELDTACVFLCLLLRDLAVPSVVRVKYLRFSTRSGLSRLICWSTLSIADSSGRVVEVRLATID